jgi:hypothetical protein
MVHRFGRMFTPHSFELAQVRFQSGTSRCPGFGKRWDWWQENGPRGPKLCCQPLTDSYYRHQCLATSGDWAASWLLVGSNPFPSLSRSDAEDEVEPPVTHRVVASTTVVEETTGAPSPPVQGEHNYGAKYATRSSEEGFGEGAHGPTPTSTGQQAARWQGPKHRSAGFALTEKKAC